MTFEIDEVEAGAGPGRAAPGLDAPRCSETRTFGELEVSGRPHKESLAREFLQPDPVIFAEIPRFAAEQDSRTKLRHHTERLEAFIRDNGLRPLAAPAYAFYNPPWTVPFLRRNEVLIEIAR